MHSNDDQSSLPATKLLLGLIVAAFVFVLAPSNSAQTPSEPPASAQSPQQSQQPAAPAPAQQRSLPPARTIELDDLAKISSVSDPQISPDGKSIAFVLSRVNLEQDRADRDLLIIDSASGAPRALTHDRKGVGSRVGRLKATDSRLKRSIRPRKIPSSSSSSCR